MRFAQENSFAPLKRFFPLFYFLQIYDKSGALPKNELLYFFVFLPPFCHEASHGTKNAVGINFYFEQKNISPHRLQFQQKYLTLHSQRQNQHKLERWVSG